MCKKKSGLHPLPEGRGLRPDGKVKLDTLTQQLEEMNREIEPLQKQKEEKLEALRSGRATNPQQTNQEIEELTEGSRKSENNLNNDSIP